MAKLKSIVFVFGVLLLILSAAMGYLSIKHLSAILPADSYEDKGVYTFSPCQVPPDVVPAVCPGRYQVSCGVPGDEWAVHTVVKDADTGEIILENDFPTRDM